MALSKYWCFTLNNWTEEEYQELIEKHEELQYLVIGKETGSGTGTRHLQGFMVANRRIRLSQCKKFQPRAHWERCKGSPVQNQTYCKKDGDFVEFGTCPGGQGTRTDLIQVLADVKSGYSLGEIREKHFAVYLRYHRALTEAIRDYSVKRTWEVDVRVYWGKTGTGKTKRAHEEASEDLYTHTGQGWFDGYSGQKDVLFDDFTGGEFKLSYLLKVLDRYPMVVPVKGGFAQWAPKRIWITSNLSPAEWYANAHEEHQRALRRRLSTVIHFEDPFGQ